MSLRIRLPAANDPVHIFIDASDGGDQGKDFVFMEGRTIPVYYYYPGERRGYVLRSGGDLHGALPNIEGGYRIILAVRGPEVERLEKAVQKLYEEPGALEEVPQGFWARLGTLVASRSFRASMVNELYLATIQRRSLLRELDEKVGAQKATFALEEGREDGAIRIDR